MNIDINIMNVGRYKGDSLSERPKHDFRKYSQPTNVPEILWNFQKSADKNSIKNLVKKVENSLGIKAGKFADILFLDLASVLLKEGGKSNTYLAANSSNCCSSADPLSSRCHDSIND